MATLGLVLSATGAAHAAPLADRDADGIYDDLEQRVRQVPAERDLRVVVRLARDATRDRADRLEDAVESLDVKRRFGVVDAVSAVVDAGEVRELSQEAGVAHVERDAPVHAMNTGAQRWSGVSEVRLDLPALTGDGDGNAASYSKDDLVAAVIDTGIYAGHVSLDAGKVLAFQDFTDGNHGDVDAPFDDEGHGTHVSTTIAGDSGSGSLRGVAPGAGLVGLKVLDSEGNGYSSDVIAALEWIDPDGTGPGTGGGTTYGIEAVNLSLGGTGCSDGQDSESDAVNALVDAGYVVTVAAGNDGPEGCTDDTGISTPAAAEKVITVGAMADVDEDGFYLAGFSSRGPTLDGRIKPDVSAPGVGITSAFNSSPTGAAIADGTSMAAPFVTGVALLMKDLNSSLTPATVKQKIMGTAIDFGAPGADSDHGAGRLDAYAAIAAATAPAPVELTSPPTVPVLKRVTSSLSATGADRFFQITPQAAPSYPLAIGLSVGNEASDFDMYLYDSTGKRVASAATPFRQDELHLASASSGPYTLRVESWSGSGNFYLDVSGAATVLETGDVPAPSSIAAPAISGGPGIGSTLTGTHGSWTGTPVITSEWERCTAAGTDCTGTGDTDLSYLVSAADTGSRIRLAVTAENQGGVTTAYSSLLAIPAVAPVNQSPPAIAGEAREGVLLSTTEGGWTGTAPIQYSYRWDRCDAAGGSCQPIFAASQSSYIPVAADVGKVLRATVTATNAGGSASAAAQTAPVAAGGVQQQGVLQPPRNELLPSVTGRARHGQLLRTDEGNWRGGAPIAFAYQWLRCNSIGFDCDPIAGATGSSYRLRAGDIERRIGVRVRASNADGSTEADSRATGIVRPARPSVRKKPSIAVRGRTLRARGGSWSGTRKIRLSFKWLRCSRSGRACKPVARGRRYVLRRADLGHRMRLRVAAVNAGGRRRALSRPTAVVRRSRLARR